MKKLPQKKVGGLLIKMCENFFEDNDDEIGDITIDALMVAFKPILDGYKQYSDVSNARSEAGKKSGLARKMKSENSVKICNSSTQSTENEVVENEQNVNKTETKTNKAETNIEQNQTNDEQNANKTETKTNKNEHIDIGIDIDIDNSRNILSSNEDVASPRIDYEKFQSVFNSKATLLPRCTLMTEKRKQKLKARIEEFKKFSPSIEPLDVFTSIVERVQQSEFCTGNNAQGWKCSFDWLIENSGNWVKVIEGCYDNRMVVPPKSAEVFHQEGIVYPKEW